MHKIYYSEKNINISQIDLYLYILVCDYFIIPILRMLSVSSLMLSVWWWANLKVRVGFLAVRVCQTSMLVHPLAFTSISFRLIFKDLKKPSSSWPAMYGIVTFFCKLREQKHYNFLFIFHLISCQLTHQMQVE